MQKLGNIGHKNNAHCVRYAPTESWKIPFLLLTGETNLWRKKNSTKQSVFPLGNLKRHNSYWKKFGGQQTWQVNQNRDKSPKTKLWHDLTSL